MSECTCTGVHRCVVFPPPGNSGASNKPKRSGRHNDNELDHPEYKFAARGDGAGRAVDDAFKQTRDAQRTAAVSLAVAQVAGLKQAMSTLPTVSPPSTGLKGGSGRGRRRGSRGRSAGNGTGRPQSRPQSQSRSRSRKAGARGAAGAKPRQRRSGGVEESKGAPAGPGSGSPPPGAGVAPASSAAAPKSAQPEATSNNGAQSLLSSKSQLAAAARMLPLASREPFEDGEFFAEVLFVIGTLCCEKLCGSRCCQPSFDTPAAFGVPQRRRCCPRRWTRRLPSPAASTCIFWRIRTWHGC